MPPESRAPVDAFVSVVVIVDEGILDAADRLAGLAGAVAARYRNYELVVVDNRLPSDLVDDLRVLLRTMPCMRVLRLSKRCSVDTAAFAGLEAAIGDFVVVTALAYDPAEVVLEVAERLRAGEDVVQGLSTGRLGGGPLTRLGRRAFYAYNARFLDVDIPARSTYLTGLSRGAANSLCAAARSHRYLRHLVRHVGYRIGTLEYALTNARMRRVVGRPRVFDAIEMISSYSVHPLRAVSLIGVAAGFTNLLYAVYVIVLTASQHVAEGWPTTSLQLSVMFFIICMILVVQAEYIGRTLSESRRESAYYVLEELESDTLLSELERRNVVSA